MKSDRNTEIKDSEEKKREKVNRIPMMRDFSFNQIEKNLLPV